MDSSSKLWFFENFNLLASLSMKDKMTLSKKAAMRKASKSEVIYFPEDDSKSIYFLKQGKVKISNMSDDGKEMIIAILGQGEIFGEMALTGEEKRDHIAEATEDAIICILSISDLEELLESNPKFNMQITKLIGLRLKRIQSRLTSLCFKNAPDRIKAFIKDMADDHGRKIVDEVEIKLSLTHKDIANLTATSRQTVTTVLNELERDNVILYDRKRLLVKNYEALNV
jgi:CRP/FNR family cyclic AMP-dependent transcriptional regulator